MYLELVGHSNPGLNLTEERKEDIRLFIQWIKDNSYRGAMTYKEIQEQIGSEDIDLNPSEIRMIAPFLKKAGFIDYGGRGASVNLDSIVTEDGEIFYRYLSLRNNIKKIGYSDEFLKNLDELVNIFFMISIIKKGEFTICLKCIEFLNLYKTMDENEFSFMTTFENDYGYGTEQYKKELDKAITKYRRGEFKDKIRIVKDRNGYQYISGLLVQCCVAIDDNITSGIKINNDYWYIFEEFIDKAEEE